MSAERQSFHLVFCLVFFRACVLFAVYSPFFFPGWFSLFGVLLLLSTTIVLISLPLAAFFPILMRAPFLLFSSFSAGRRPIVVFTAPEQVVFQRQTPTLIFFCSWFVNENEIMRRTRTRTRAFGLALVVFALGLVFVAHHLWAWPFGMLSRFTASAEFDLMTADQRVLVARLRTSLRQNNEDNDPDAGHPDSFVHGPGEPAGITRVASLDEARFQQAVAASEPIIITGGAPCTKHPWSLDFIRRVAGSDVVGVETSKSNRFYSNEGLQKVNMTVAAFLDEFRSPSRRLDLYLAEEDLSEMPGLQADVMDPLFAADAQLDRLQLWIGAGGQVSPLHHDQWDNVLCQIEGVRKLTLFDPLQVDRLYPKAGVNRHFSFVDPEKPNDARFPRFKDARVHHVELHAGESMVIPAFWWHQVRHEDSVNIAVNFWYVPSSLLAELLYDVLLPPGPN